MEVSTKTPDNHKPVFTPNPLAKPIRWFSYPFPNTAARIYSRLWSTPINMGKGLYIKKLKQNADHIITTGMTPIYGYGNSDKHIILMHGWNARGGQLRKFITPLVEKGYCVWWFDALGFGEHSAKKSNAYQFSKTLVDVQSQIIHSTKQPIFATIAHSLGCLATILASDPKLYDTAYNCKKMIWIAPSLSPKTMFDSYCEHMNIREKVKRHLYSLVENEMKNILQENPWAFFEKPNLFKHLPQSKYLMFDKNDEEVLQSDFFSIEKRINAEKVLKTDHLGHYHMLKDQNTIDQITQFIDE